MLCIHIAFLGTLSAMVFTFRIAIPDLMDEGDQMHAWFKLIPTYNVGSAVYCDRSCEILSDVRSSPYSTAAKTSADKWAFENITLDSLMMIFHLVGWVIVLIAIEKGLFKMMVWKVDSPTVNDALSANLDEDVRAEAERIQ